MGGWVSGGGRDGVNWADIREGRRISGRKGGRVDIIVSIIVQQKVKEDQRSIDT